MDLVNIPLMPQPEPRTRPDFTRWLALGSLVLSVLGVRLWEISRYGSDLPFWDQWYAEAKDIFQRHFAGTLTIGHWFAPHNEHRIPFTRLIAFGLMRADGQWDARVQMVLNAFLCAIVVAGLWVAIMKGVRRGPLLLGTLLLAVVFSLPYGWENTLVGFQSQFYMLNGFSLAAIYLLTTERALSGRWFLGLLAAASALLCLGSGLFAPLAVLVFQALRLMRDRRDWRRASREMAPAFATCIPLVAIGAMLTVQVEQHAKLRAQSAWEFAYALGRYLAWPWVMRPAWALFTWLPIVALSVAYVRGRARDGSRERLALGMGAWAFLQAVALAFARVGGFGSSRYGDVLVFGLIANAIAFTTWIGWSTWWKRAAAAGFAAWLAVSGRALIALSFAGDVSWRAYEYAIQRGRVAAFVDTGDVRYLSSTQGAPTTVIEIPCWEAGPLVRLLADRDIRNILPGSVEERPTTSAITVAPARERVDGWRPGAAPDFWEPVWRFGSPAAREGEERFAFRVEKRIGRPVLHWYMRGPADAISVSDAGGARVPTVTLAPHESSPWRPVIAWCPTRTCIVEGPTGVEGVRITEAREIGTLAAGALVLSWEAHWILLGAALLAAGAIMFSLVALRPEVRTARATPAQPAPTGSGSTEAPTPERSRAVGDDVAGH
jgi:hypothetical protein